jgi:hypothetical protein
MSIFFKRFRWKLNRDILIRRTSVRIFTAVLRNKAQKTVKHIADTKIFSPMFNVRSAVHIFQFSLGSRCFHLRMDVRVAFSLWRSACNPSASLVQPPPVFPFPALRETDPCWQTILEIYFQIPGPLPTYEIRHGTSQGHLFELERIGKWVL